MNVLEGITDGVRADLAERQRQVPLAALRRQVAKLPATLDAAAALRRPGVQVIAEVKRARPCRQAAVVSVLTEGRRFGGSLADLVAVRAAVAHGANAVLVGEALVTDDRPGPAPARLCEAGRPGPDRRAAASSVGPRPYV